MVLPYNNRRPVLHNRRMVPVFEWPPSTMAIDDESLGFLPFVCCRPQRQYLHVNCAAHGKQLRLNLSYKYRL